MMTEPKLEGCPDKNRTSLGEEKRNYGCPCGKTYLSYPALFTHVKQKHDGKPPGELIKPKKEQNAKRGRPPIHPHDKNEEDEAKHFNYEEYFSKTIPEDTTVPFEGEFSWAEGNENCNQIFSRFLNAFVTNKATKAALNCLVLLLKQRLETRFGPGYCEKEDAGDIIDLTNDIVREYDDFKEQFPLPKQMLVDLLWGFFTWLYKQKLTDHKLERQDREE